MAPLADRRARLLVLGSLPGAQSLSEQRYYAHPRNQFWRVMEASFALPAGLDYASRVAAVQARGVAIWDVLASGIRPGSLDASIELPNAETNDFTNFLDGLPALQRIVFNGALAEALFVRRVLPTLPARHQALERIRLPSTSPANAAIPAEQKLARWHAALRGAG